MPTPPWMEFRKPDRFFAQRIYEGSWSSDAARDDALLALARAYSGTSGIDRSAWAKALVDGVARQILSRAIRLAAQVHPDEAKAAALLSAARQCEADGAQAEIAEIAKVAKDSILGLGVLGSGVTGKAEGCARCAAAALDAYVGDDLSDSAWDAAESARLAAEAAAAFVMIQVNKRSYPSADDHDAARRAADAAAKDEILRLAVQVAVDAYAAQGVSR